MAKNNAFIPCWVNWAVWSTSCLNISRLYLFQNLYYSVVGSFAFITSPFILHCFKTLLIYSLVSQKSLCIFLTYFKALFSISWSHSAYFLDLFFLHLLIKMFFLFPPRSQFPSIQASTIWQKCIKRCLQRDGAKHFCLLN